MDEKSFVGMMQCFYCLEPYAIAIDRHIQRKKLPREAVYDMNPCDKCKEYMAQGVIVISVRNGEMEKVERDLKLARAEYSREESRHHRAWSEEHPFSFVPNPFRSGVWVVVKDESIEKMITPGATRDQILKGRWTFIEDAAAEKIGLTVEAKKVVGND